MTDTAPCRCGHTEAAHQAAPDAQCTRCPGDDERTWRHPYTPESDTTPLTDQQLAEIRQRAHDATDGPWWNDEHEIYAGDVNAYDRWVGETCDPDAGDGGSSNAVFIAYARTDVPALLAEVGRLRAVDAAILQVMDRVKAHANRDGNAVLFRVLSDLAVARGLGRAPEVNTWQES